MRNEHVRIRASLQDRYLSPLINLLIYKPSDDGNGDGHVGSIIMEPHNQCNTIRPALSIDATTAQELMDTLYTCGIRPTEGKGSAGSLEATERHLADMQKLVFKNK